LPASGVHGSVDEDGDIAAAPEREEEEGRGSR
jgi:hypothetical protein